MFVDTHLHLHNPYFDENKLDAVIKDITENKIITWAQSCDFETHKVVLERSKLSEYIFPSFGVLPWYAHNVIDKHEEIAKLCEEAIMLGEIGLDEKYTREKESIPHQLALFEIFLHEAEKNNKIMNCHFRGKERESFEIVSNFKAKKIIFHAYSGDIKLMKDINDKGYYYSVGPRYIAEKLKLIPDDLLLIEIDVLQSDSEKLPSEIFKEMLDRIALIRNTTPEEIEAINYNNVLRLVKDDSRLSKMVSLMIG